MCVSPGYLYQTIYQKDFDSSFVRVLSALWWTCRRAKLWEAFLDRISILYVHKHLTFFTIVHNKELPLIVELHQNFQENPLVTGYKRNKSKNYSKENILNICNLQQRNPLIEGIVPFLLVMTTWLSARPSQVDAFRSW